MSTVDQPAGDVTSAARIKEALLREYPWRKYDQWDGEEAPQGSWPHLEHVAAIAAEAAHDNLRAFVQSALANAEATTDAAIRGIAKRVDPIGIAATNYGTGMRDGVIETCHQILARLDPAAPSSPGQADR